MSVTPGEVQQQIGRSVAAAVKAAGSMPEPAGPRPSRSGPIDIAIPIYNGAELLALCLDALLPTLSDGDAVWLLDDASEEAGIAGLLTDFSRRWPATHCVRNPQNLGFVGTANRAIVLTRRDLVLLNSDTEPTAGWLEELQACLARNTNAGIVCPLSDRATLLSILPRSAKQNHAAIAAAAAESTVGDVMLPTAVGFCMLMRRDCLDEIGAFSQVFAPGYGEENDLSMRALRAGWDILAADRACVYHHSGGSFDSAQSRSLRIRHEQTLNRIWPVYGPLVMSWWRDNPLRIRTEQLARQGDDRPGVLHVLHRQYHIGGTERVTRMLIGALSERYRQLLVYPGQTGNAWCDLEQLDRKGMRELMLNNRWIRPRTRIAGHGADLACRQSERMLARLVLGSGARIVHFHHLLHWDSLMLPALARALGCRVVVSVHDFWFNCPIHNQLEHGSGIACGRSHARPDDRCANCLSGYSGGTLAPAADGSSAVRYAELRHELMGELLRQTDAILVPSEFIRDKILGAFPNIDGETIHLEPHGVAMPDSRPHPAGGDQRVLAYFGGDQAMKGAGIVLQLAAALRDAPVTFRIFGRIKGFDRASVPPNVELRGFYNPDDVGRCMQGADLALLPSFYEESFSMVASECWAHGVPVLASSRGALAERVKPGSNGWLVADMEPETWLQSLRKLLQGNRIERCRERLSREPVRSIEQSSSALDLLYCDLLALEPAKPISTEPGRPLPQFRKVLKSLRAGAVKRANQVTDTRCLGIVRDHWGTANYRVRFPLEDLARSPRFGPSRFHVVREEGFDPATALQRSGARHVVVQPFLSDEGLGLMEALHREAGFDITLVVDDLWTDLQADNPVRASMPENVPQRLAYAAALAQSVVLTTAELRRRLPLAHDNIHVINNALPEWVWGSLANAAPADRARLRVGWSGAPQHAADLRFLAAVIRETRDLADWVFMGMCPPELRELGCEQLPMVPFGRYPAALAALQLDLAIAPLTDHPFNRCKSHLKLLEYGILGLPVVAADLEPYRDCPVTRAAPDDAEAWTAAIRDLLCDRQLRVGHGNRLRQWVLKNHMAEHRRPDWEAALGARKNAG